MKLFLHAVHFTLTEAIKDKVNESLVVPLQQIVQDEEARLEVHLEDEECRVTLHLSHHQPPLHVTVRSDNLYKSIQQAHVPTVQLAKKALARHRHPSADGRAAEV